MGSGCLSSSAGGARSGERVVIRPPPPGVAPQSQSENEKENDHGREGMPMLPTSAAHKLSAAMIALYIQQNYQTIRERILSCIVARRFDVQIMHHPSIVHQIASNRLNLHHPVHRPADRPGFGRQKQAPATPLAQCGPTRSYRPCSPPRSPEQHYA